MAVVAVAVPQAPSVFSAYVAHEPSNCPEFILQMTRSIPNLPTVLCEAHCPVETCLLRIRYRQRVRGVRLTSMRYATTELHADAPSAVVPRFLPSMLSLSGVSATGYCVAEENTLGMMIRQLPDQTARTPQLKTDLGTRVHLWTS